VSNTIVYSWGLLPGTYELCVSTVCEDGESEVACADPVTIIVVLSPPSNLVAFANNLGWIDLTWNAPDGDKSIIINQGSGNVSSSGPVEMSPIVNTDPIPSDGQFDLLFDFAVAGTSEAGIETDGIYIYTSVWNGSGAFLKYDNTGNFIGEFTIGGAGGCRDIAYNGTYFYGSAASTTIFEMDFETTTMVSTFTGPAACRAIAYNELDDVFYCNNWSDDITKFDMSGAMMGSFPVGPVGASYYGFAFDDYSGGTYLWGYAQVGASSNELVQIALPSGTETGLYFDVGSIINPAGSGIAGGLCIDGAFIPGYYSIIGNMQGISLWGLELVNNTELLGYNIYHQFEGGSFNLLDFTTSTNYIHDSLSFAAHCYYVTAVYQSGESDSSNIDCEMPISVENFLVSSLQIYPNPATDMVTIKSDYIIQNIVVYNFSGQLVSNEQINNTTYTVDVSQFKPGVYIFLMDTENGRITQRVVIE